MAEKVLIYRPLGDHPPGTKMGDLLLGSVHSVTTEQAATYALKGFVKMPADAKSANPAVLASMYAIAKSSADAEAKRVADEKKAAEAQPITSTLTTTEAFSDAPVAMSSDSPLGATEIIPEAPENRRKDRG